MASLVLDKPLPRGIDLPYEDGEPLESDWHLAAMTLLLHILRYHYRDRTDHYVAGNMFVYFDPDQVKTRNFRGPDFFVVKGVTSPHFRNSWVVWEEGGLTPDYVIALASESTKAFDLHGKKAIYEQQLKTPEYIVYDPTSEQLQGWRLDQHGHYQIIMPDERGWLWSEQLKLWLGAADYRFTGAETVKTLRFFKLDGRCLPTEAEVQARRAEEQTARAVAAEAELVRLKAELAIKS